MPILETLRSNLKTAMKESREQEKNLLRLIIGETERSPKTDDEAVKQIIKKMIINNTAKQ